MSTAIVYEDASELWSTRLTKLGALLDAGDFAHDRRERGAPVWTPMVWAYRQRRKHVLEHYGDA